MKYLHTMVRVSDLARALDFYCHALGLREIRRIDNPQGQFTLVFLAAPADLPDQGIPAAPLLELTYNWNTESLDPPGRAFGHLAFEVADVHACCARLQTLGIVINRPPRDGRMAFIRSPEGISIELLQKGPALEPVEPWRSMANSGSW